jgi:hypothetical protein
MSSNVSHSSPIFSAFADIHGFSRCSPARLAVELVLVVGLRLEVKVMDNTTVAR